MFFQSDFPAKFFVEKLRIFLEFFFRKVISVKVRYFREKNSLKKKIFIINIYS